MRHMIYDINKRIFSSNEISVANFVWVHKARFSNPSRKQLHVSIRFITKMLKFKLRTVYLNLGYLI